MGERGRRGLIADLAATVREIDLSTHSFYLRRDGPRRAPWSAAAPEEDALAPFSTPPGRALDLGCGGGRHAVYLANLGWSVVAVDLYPWTAARARRCARAAGVADRVAVLRAPVTRLPERLGRFDLVLDVLGPASDLRRRDLGAYARAVAAHLAPAGRLVVQTYLTEDELAPLRAHLRPLRCHADPVTRWLVYGARSEAATPQKTVS